MSMGPLSGIRIIEVGRFISAPFATMLLADLGAEVIKVETVVGGDPFRQVGEDHMPARFLAYNRNKRSIALDLRSDSGRQIFMDLLATADVLVENFRPGVMDSFGLGADDLRARHERLVYCSITGAGSTGPLASVPMYDAIGQALSGLSEQFAVGGNPQPAGPAMSDSITGMTAALAIQAALLQRHRTQKGAHVQTSLLEATTSFLAEPAAHWFRTGEEQDWLTRPRQSQSFGFKDSEGRAFAIHLSSPEKFWERLLEVVERPELAVDSRFATYQLRVTNYLALQAELQEVFGAKSRDHWLAELKASDVPAAPVLSTKETFAHPQIQELGLEQQLSGPGQHRVVGPGARVGEWQPPMAQPPAHGADGEDLLAELRYSVEQVAALRAGGVVG